MMDCWLSIVEKISIFMYAARKGSTNLLILCGHFESELQSHLGLVKLRINILYTSESLLQKFYSNRGRQIDFRRPG